MSNDEITDTPQNFLLCHPRISKTLIAIMRAQRIPALLFAGQTGVGKRTAALLFAQAVNCEAQSARQGQHVGCGNCHTCISIARLTHPDVRLILPTRFPKETSQEELSEALYREYPEYRLGTMQPPVDERALIGVELARWMRLESVKPPLTARYRFFIILHAHRLNAESAATLLKTLEETHPNTAFVLCTDRPWLIPGTVRSRCRLLRFAPIDSSTMAKWLRNRTHDNTAASLSAAVLYAQGSPGEALRYLHSGGNDPAVISCNLCSSNTDTAGKGGSSTIPPNCPLLAASAPELSRTLFALYRGLLKAKLGLDVPHHEISSSSCPFLTANCSSRNLTTILRLLHRRLEDTNLNTNPALTSYTLLWLISRLNASASRCSALPQPRNQTRSQL